MTPQEREHTQLAVVALWTVGLLLGVVVGLAASDVILGVIAGASCIAIGVGLLRLWTGSDGPTARDM